MSDIFNVGSNVNIDIDRIPLVADDNNFIVFYTVFNNEKHIVVVSNRRYIEHEGKYKYYIQQYYESGAYGCGPGYLSSEFTHLEREDFKVVPHEMVNISYMANFNEYIINERTKEAYEHNWKIVKRVFNNITDIIHVYSIGVDTFNMESEENRVKI